MNLFLIYVIYPVLNLYKLKDRNMLQLKKIVLKMVSQVLIITVSWCSVGSRFLPIKDVYASSATAVPAAEMSALPVVKGVRYNRNSPFELDFIIQNSGSGPVHQEEKSRLIRYFLSALTIPEDDLWVNLSPYEHDRIIDDTVAETEIGEVLLEQDYLLKQLSAALTHPDTSTGKKYWSGLTPYNLNFTSAQGAEGDLSRIWIKPERVSVYDNNNILFVDDIVFKVECEDVSGSVLLDPLTCKVNTSEEFAPLRQMVHSIAAAQLFKRRFSESLYAFYFDAAKTAGLDIADPDLKEEVFKKYVKAFDAGAYDVTRRELVNDRIIKRRYFSGGVLPGISSSQFRELTLESLDTAQHYDFSRTRMFVLDSRPLNVSSALVSYAGVFDGAWLRAGSGFERHKKIKALDEKVKKYPNAVEYWDNMRQLNKNTYILGELYNAAIGLMRDDSPAKLAITQELIRFIVEHAGFGLEEKIITDWKDLLEERPHNNMAAMGWEADINDQIYILKGIIDADTQRLKDQYETLNMMITSQSDTVVRKYAPGELQRIEDETDGISSSLAEVLEAVVIFVAVAAFFAVVGLGTVKLVSDSLWHLFRNKQHGNAGGYRSLSYTQGETIIDEENNGDTIDAGLMPVVTLDDLVKHKKSSSSSAVDSGDDGADDNAMPENVIPISRNIKRSAGAQSAQYVNGGVELAGLMDRTTVPALSSSSVSASAGQYSVQGRGLGFVFINETESVPLADIIRISPAQ